MRRNTAKHKLAAGQPISVVSPGHTSPSLVEFVAQLGFDAVFIDGEHGSGSWEDTENQVRAAELGGATPICRVQANDASIITRTLDRGAGGVQVPHINTRAEAELAVRHTKYAPLGERGWYGGRASYGVAATEYASHANDETLLVIMLEESEALRNLEDIVKVDHIDVFFIAPGDLAQSMGYAGQMEHPNVVQAIERGIGTIRQAGKAAGVLSTPATVDRYLELGALYLFVGLANFLSPSIDQYLSRFKR